MSEKLGKMISTLMKRRGVTIDWLADEVGVRNDTLCKYISGEKTPTDDKIKRLANALKVSKEFLLGKLIVEYDGGYTTVDPMNIEELEHAIRLIRDDVITETYVNNEIFDAIADMLHELQESRL